MILDDKKARKIARQLQLPVLGTVAVLLRAKERQLIATVREVLDDLMASGFYLSPALFTETLKQAGE